MYNYFYKITNKLTGEFYYGVHSTNNLDDGYMGSGKKLNAVYKKYGKKNFEKEILRFFDSPEEMFEHERRVVTKDLIKDPMCYNLTEGGDGYRIGHYVTEETRQKMSLQRKGAKSKTKGYSYYHLGTVNKMVPPDKVSEYEANGWIKGPYISEESRKRLVTHGFTGKKHSAETLKVLSDIKKEHVRNGTFVPHNKGKHLSEEQKKLLSEINRGKTMSEEARKKVSAAHKGKKRSAETCKKISEALKGHTVSEETRKKIGTANTKRMLSITIRGIY